MKMTSVNRFERDANKIMLGQGLNKFAYKKDVINPLHHEHLAVMRMIDKDILKYQKIVADAGVTRDEHIQAYAA